MYVEMSVCFNRNYHFRFSKLDLNRDHSSDVEHQTSNSMTELMWFNQSREFRSTEFVDANPNGNETPQGVKQLTKSAENLNARPRTTTCPIRDHSHCRLVMRTTNPDDIRTEEPLVVKPVDQARQTKFTSNSKRDDPRLYAGILRKQDLLRFLQEVNKSDTNDLVEQVYRTHESGTKSDTNPYEKEVDAEHFNRDGKEEVAGLNEPRKNESRCTHTVDESTTPVEELSKNVFVDKKNHVLTYWIPVLLDGFTLEEEVRCSKLSIRIRKGDSDHRLPVLFDGDDTCAIDLTNLIETGENWEKLLKSTNSNARNKVQNVAYLMIKKKQLNTVDSFALASSFSAQLHIALSRKCRYIRDNRPTTDRPITGSYITQLDRLIFQAADAVNRIPKLA